jgi:hypothetical protein
MAGACRQRKPQKIKVSPIVHLAEDKAPARTALRLADYLRSR